MLTTTTPITHEALLAMDFTQLPNGLYFVSLDGIGWLDFFVAAPNGYDSVTVYASYTESQEHEGGCILRGAATTLSEIEALYEKGEAWLAANDAPHIPTRSNGPLVEESISDRACTAALEGMGMADLFTEYPEGTTPW